MIHKIGRLVLGSCPQHAQQGLTELTLMEHTINSI